RRFVVAATMVVAAFLLPGCSKTDSATLIASAKSYFEKADYNAGIIQLKTALQKDPGNGEARFLLGKSLLATGDPVAAETELRKAMELKYPAKEVYPSLARALLMEGDSKKVLSELGAVKLDDAEGRADLANSLAIANLSLGDTNATRASIDAALAESPSNARALTTMAQLNALANDFPGAYKNLDAALAAAPNDTEAILFKAQLQIIQGQRDEAIKTLEDAIAANGRVMSLRLALVPLLVSARQLDKATAQVDAMKQMAPTLVGTLYADALVAFSRRNPTYARDLIQKVLVVTPDNLRALYLSGIINLELGSFNAAEDSLRKVVAQAPGAVDARRMLALTYLRSGRTGQAIDAAEAALRSAPDDIALLRTAGEAYLAAGNLAKAGEVYERASKLDKGSEQTKMRLAQVRFAAGDTTRAIGDLQSLSDADASHYQADLALITAHLRKREFDKALAAANGLEKKQPGNPLTYRTKGMVYVTMRDFKNGRAAFEKALQIQPTDFAAAHSLALLDVQERQEDNARKRYEQMLAKDPKNEDLLLAMVELLAITRHSPDEVKAAIDRTIAANPKSVRPRLTLINFYRQQSDEKAALSAAQSAQEAFPNDPQILEALGSVQLTNSANQALDTFKRLVQLQGENPSTLMRVAEAQLVLKNYSAAVETLHKIVTMQPDGTQAWVRLAQAYVAAGNPDSAITEARKLQKDRADRALGFVIEAQVLANQKKWAEAAAVYREALARQPFPIIAVYRYIALQNARKTDEATAMADTWMREHPKDTTLRVFLAEQSLRKKDYRGAATQFRTALEIEPDNPVILNNLAWALIEVDDPKSAEIAEKAYVQAPGNPNVIDTLGWALVQTGDANKGLELLRTASNLAPANEEIRLHLARALIKTRDPVGAKKELETLAKTGKSGTIRSDAQKLLSSL
ncbi:MAG: PEP-CTERM system TPR-repeat protein PrsT, partial [Betaproteobacteria bacterium]